MIKQLNQSKDELNEMGLSNVEIAELTEEYGDMEADVLGVYADEISFVLHSDDFRAYNPLQDFMGMNIFDYLAAMPNANRKIEAVLPLIENYNEALNGTGEVIKLESGLMVELQYN